MGRPCATHQRVFRGAGSPLWWPLPGIVGALLPMLAACGAERPLPPAAHSADKALTQPARSADGDVRTDAALPTLPSDPNQERLALLQDIAALRSESSRLGLRYAEQHRLATQAEALGQALCKRAGELLERCPVARPLAGDTLGTGGSWLGPCAAHLTGDKKYLESWVRINIPQATGAGAGAGAPMLRLKTRKGTLVSSPVTASGVREPLTWRLAPESAAQGAATPHALELTYGNNIEGYLIETADGVTPLPPWTQEASLGFATGDDVVLDSAPLPEWQPGATSVHLPALSLIHMLKKPSCSVTEDDIDALAKRLAMTPQTEAQLPAPQPVATKHQEASADSLRQLRQHLGSELEARRKNLSLVSTRLGASSDRTTTIRQFVRRLGSGGSESRCASTSQVGILEVFFEGSHLPDSDWDRNATGIERKTEGSPEQIEISLGEKLVFVQVNELAKPILSSAGYLRQDSFADRHSLDITHIRMSKLGTGYQALLNCWTIIGWSRWGLGKKCEFQNRETHRYTLRSIEIRLDGALFFKKTGIDFVFGNNKNTWSTHRLSESPEYLDYMKGQHCNGGE